MCTSQNWKGKPTIDVKSAILETLTDPRKVFKRDTRKTGWWMNNVALYRNLATIKESSPPPPPSSSISHAQKTALKEESNVTVGNKNIPNPISGELSKGGRGSRLRSRRTQEPQSVSLDQTQPQPQTQPSSKVPNKEELSESFLCNADTPTEKNPEMTKEDEEFENNNGRNKPPTMTDLQFLIAEAIEMNGNWANFDQIYDYVVKFFDGLRRRNGSHYSSDCRRTIQTSLSSRPFFKRESRKSIPIWALTKKAEEFLVEHKRKKTQGESIELINQSLELDENDIPRDNEDIEKDSHMENNGNLDDDKNHNHSKNNDDHAVDHGISSETEIGSEENDLKRKTPSNENEQAVYEAEEKKEENKTGTNEKERNERSFNANRWKRAQRLQDEKRQLNETGNFVWSLNFPLSTTNYQNSLLS